MTDFWPSEKGLIVEGLTIGFFYCTAAVAEGAPCKMGTPASGRIAVTTAAAFGDAMLVALKAGGIGETIPCAESGVMKMTVAQAAAVTAGDFVMNSAEVGVKIGQGGSNSTLLKLFGGDSYVLGMALQTSAAASDEILVLLGKYT